MQDPRKFMNATHLIDDPCLATPPPSLDTELSERWQECLSGPFRYAALAESVLAELGFGRALTGGQGDRSTNLVRVEQAPSSPISTTERCSFATT
jgi:hypothetical protein